MSAELAIYRALSVVAHVNRSNRQGPTSAYRRVSRAADRVARDDGSSRGLRAAAPRADAAVAGWLRVSDNHRGGGGYYGVSSFDEVNHDLLMARVRRKVRDNRMRKLIRAFLSSGVMIGGLTQPTEKGTPQGGPLSPLLSNILLDELDKELEKRGHCFCRYADDCVPRTTDRTMILFACVTAKPMRETKAPRDRLTGAGLKSPLAAVVKSHGRERRRKRPGYPGQMSDREMNASKPLMTCRKRRNEVETGRESLTRDQHGRRLFRAVRPPALRWHDPITRRLCGTWEPSAPMPTERFKQTPCEDRSRNAARRGGMARSSNEVPDKGMEPRGRIQGGWFAVSTGNGRNQ